MPFWMPDWQKMMDDAPEIEVPSGEGYVYLGLPTTAAYGAAQASVRPHEHAGAFATGCGAFGLNDRGFHHGLAVAQLLFNFLEYFPV